MSLQPRHEAKGGHGGGALPSQLEIFASLCPSKNLKMKTYFCLTTYKKVSFFLTVKEMSVSTQFMHLCIHGEKHIMLYRVDPTADMPQPVLNTRFKH